MTENLTATQIDLQPSSTSLITRSCYKFNSTFPHQIDSCNAQNLEKNACFVVWELNSSEPYKNITDIIRSCTLSLKGCWTGHSMKKDFCHYNDKIDRKKTIICYCKGDNCNEDNKPKALLLENINFIPNSLEKKISNESIQQNQSHLIYYIFPILILLIITFVFFYQQRSKLQKIFMSQSINAIKQSHLNVIETQEPLLFKSAPKIVELIKQGQFCNIYKGKIDKRASTEQLTLIHPGQQAMHDLEQTVAIKAYSQQMYESFKHELNVYNLARIKYKNILKFISYEEKRISPNSSEYWLVLEYHELGSLYDYLKSHTVTYTELIDICLDIATGLAHLHNNNLNCVIHRDLNTEYKSKNILLKNDLTACISDFNRALVLYPNQPASENLDQVGTVRYMSPEVLDCAIQFTKDGFMKIDIYSTSLIFWELLSRCSAHSSLEDEYKMPYEEELGTYLIREQLRKHVSLNKMRPKIPDHWCDHNDLKEFAKTIIESWDDDAEARLTASGIVERLKRIKRK